MNLAQDLLSAARWAEAEAAVATDPRFLRPHQALQAAAQSLGRAWSGSWQPGLVRLYDRHLQALPLHLRMRAGVDALEPTPELLERCRVWTSNQIREVICNLAGAPDRLALESAAASATARVDDARACFKAMLWHMESGRNQRDELDALARAARHITVPSSVALIESLRPAATRRRAGFEDAPFEGPPPHLAELAALEALLGPFEALRQFANLMRCAAERVQVPARWRAVLTPHLVARRVEWCPA